MHPLFGGLDGDGAPRAAAELADERVALLAIMRARPTDVRGEVALPHEVRHDRLLEARGLAIDEIPRVYECVHQRPGDDHVADP